MTPATAPTPEKQFEDELEQINAAAAAIHSEAANQRRHAIIRAASKHGLTVTELVQRGILHGHEPATATPNRTLHHSENRTIILALGRLLERNASPVDTFEGVLSNEDVRAISQAITNLADRANT